MHNYIILENSLVNRGEKHLFIVCALDVPPCYYIAPVASPVSIGLLYHFSFDTHSI
jgi:hypothetical protein